MARVSEVNEAKLVFEAGEVRVVYGSVPAPNVEADKRMSCEIENAGFDLLFVWHFDALVQALKEKFPNVVMEFVGHTTGRHASKPVYRMVKSVKYQRNSVEYKNCGNDRHFGNLDLKGNVLVCGKLPDGSIVEYQFLTWSDCWIYFTDKPFEVGTSDLFSEIETKAEDVIDFIREYWKEPEICDGKPDNSNI